MTFHPKMAYDAAFHKSARALEDEGPRGEQGFSVVSDGTNRPWRIKSRAPSLLACQALERMIVGGLIADVIAVIGSIDVVMGDVDR